MKKFIGVLLIIGLFFLATSPLKVHGDGPDAFLIVTNPSEDTSKEMNIAWHTTILGTFVEYTIKEDSGFASSNRVLGECQAITYYDEGIKADITDYKCDATLTNLTSDTEYIYRVGKTNFSSTYGFTTSGTSAFTFMYFSDVHVYLPIPSRYNSAQKLINVIESKYRNLKFVVTGGDMTAYGTVRDDWKSYYSLSMFSKYMIASTPGNHEYYNRSAKIYADSRKYFDMYSNNPDNGAEGVKNGSYFFQYGSVLFISLDSEAYRLSSQPAEYKTNQKEWLTDVLENHPSQYIVLFHHMYHYAGNEVSSSMRDLQPIIDKYGVDLVLTGHDHVYTRSNRIYNGTNSTDGKKGAIYITGSAIGDRLEAETSLSTDVYVAKKIGNTSIAMGITVSSETLMLKTYDETGTMLDQIAIPAKMSNFDVADSMKEVKVEVAEDFPKSKLVYPNAFFAKAYKIELLEGEEIISSFRPLDNQTSLIIPNLKANDYRKNYKVNVYFRDGQTATKDIELINPNAVFGKIENVRIDGDKLVWDSQIDNEMLTKIVIYVNDKLLTEVSPTTKEVSLSSIDTKKENNIVFQALDNNDVVLYTSSLTYGENYIPIKLGFSVTDVELKVGESEELVVTVSPNKEVSLIFSSSDSSVVRIEGQNIIAVKEGEVTITVTAVGHEEAIDTLTVKVIKVEEPKEPTEEPKEPEVPIEEPEKPIKEKGCQAGMRLWYFLIPLALVFIRRKRY
jgi:hypothetical protein